MRRDADPSFPKTTGDDAPTMELPLESVAWESAPNVPREEPGSWIGVYQLKQLVGEGAFGRVYVAEQARPVRRTVALKILKAGMDTVEVVGRFAQERQALAWMDHPGIAKVFDAGSTPAGRPYFVMEYCPGETMVVFCDRQRLPLEARLELFEQVCHAIQHAHQRGLIHRDIKPGNILVTMSDGHPVAKVIDFGIAKATAGRTDEDAFVTQYRHMIGTPQYMSPEQAEGSQDIDTRTDVYALGMVLYELIAGAAPLKEALTSCQGMADLARVIREEQPEPPSRRLRSAGASLGELAEARGTNGPQLIAAAQGELDWVVMKAIEKDRNRRYPTAADLALDVHRFVNGQVVMAVPPSTWYKAGKFVRRHKVGVAAAAAVAAALVAGLAGTAWQATIAAEQRDLARRAAARADERARAAQQAEAEQRRLALAEAAGRAEAQRQREAADAAASRERERAEELRLVAEFQARMLNKIDPAEAGEALMTDLRRKYAAALVSRGIAKPAQAARAATFAADLQLTNATDAAVNMIDRNVLRPAIVAIDAQFGKQPAVDAALRESIAGLLRNLGRYEDARPLQERAWQTRRRTLGELHPDTLASLDQMGLQEQAQGKLAEAEGLLRDAWQKRTRVFGARHPATLASLNHLGFLHLAQARLPEAEREFRQAIAGREQVLGANHPDTLESWNHLSVLLRQQDRFQEAEPILRRVVAQRRRVPGEDDPETLVSIGYLGALLRKVKRFDEAEPLLREALEKRRRVLGETHPETLASLNNVGQLLRQVNKLDEAQGYLHDALEGRRRTLGEDHPSTLVSRIDMGQLLRKQKRHREAEAEFRFTVDAYARQFGKENWRTADARVHLSESLVDLKRFAEAEGQLREAEAVFGRTLGEASARRVECLKELGKLERKWEAAEPGRGHAARSAEWRAMADQLKSRMVGAESEEEPEF